MYDIDSRTVAPEAILVHWFEQSAFAVKNSEGKILLVDPYFPTDRDPERFIQPEPPVNPAALRPDVVILTHDHSDHTHPESIAAIAANSPNTVFVGPEESVSRIETESAVPRERCRVIAAGGSEVVAGITVHAVFSKPPAGDPGAGIEPPNTAHLGFVVTTGGRRLYFSGDPINTIGDLPSLTDPIRALGPEVAFLTTHPTEGEFPDFDGARRLAEAVGVDIAVPSHYQCFTKRTYDPADFAAAFAHSSIAVLTIPWNGSVKI